ncbi:MAG: EamA family transporter [Cyanobacteriota bacterium]|nr:EamA family transporter [Cyanobacteriota bacterium]
MIAGLWEDALLGGVLAALAAALCWTLASFCWRRLPSALGSAELNLLKNALGLLLLVPLQLLLWQPQPPLTLLLLAASGIVGIAAGDSLFFAALRRLGARSTLTIEAGAPVLTTLAGLWLLAEWPDGLQLLGLALVSAAVVLVARRAAGVTGSLQPAAARLGVLLALLAVLCGSGGALLSRQVLAPGAISPWQAAAVRLAAATLVQLPLAQGLLVRVWLRPGPRPAGLRWPLVLLATLLGTTLGIGLQQAALAQLPAAQAVTLLATAPAMAVLLAPLDRDCPGLSGVLAALLAAVGVWCVVA